jgi:hypothetical protein
MALAALNLPIDIPWERVCVTRDMVYPGPGAGAETPPIWQSSMALYRYVPPDEYQIYPARRILYYKLTCTITNYQPRDQAILGTIDPYGLATNTLADEEVKRRLEQSLPCTAAVVQVTATASEGARAPNDQPYFLEAQPRQRVLYEQVTETQERASRSLETLQVRKDLTSSNSVEVLDVDRGSGLQVGVGGGEGGVGVNIGGQRSGDWGSKSLGRQDSTLITTTDGSREARETLAFTTQLAQMYTLLQAYHLGTNRVVFYVTPRPHTVEPLTGLSGPRQLDGVQDFFLVVSQARADRLPCITARLDTGHLAVQPLYDYDTAQPPQTLAVEAVAPAPLERDPTATRTSQGESEFYHCRTKSVVQRAELTAPSGYVIQGTEDLENLATGRGSVTNVSTVDVSPDGRQVSIVATATGYACHRNTAGDIANKVATGPFDWAGLDVWPESKSETPGRVRRSVRVSFRSELPTRKVRDQLLLVLTTRQLHCCEAVTTVGPKVTVISPFDVPDDVTAVAGPGAAGVSTQIDLADTATGSGAGARAPMGALPAIGLAAPQPRAAGGPTGGAVPAFARRMSLAAVNAMQRRLAEETQRLAMGLRDPEAAPPRDGELLLRTVLSAVLADPRRRRDLARDVVSLGLSRRTANRLAEALGRPGQTPMRLDLVAAPDAVIEAVTGRRGPALLRLRLGAAGLPVVAAARRARGRRRRR